MLKKIISLSACSIILIILLAVVAFADNTSVLSSLSFKANLEDDNTAVNVQMVENKGAYLFLPSSADLTNIILTYSDSITSVELSTEKGSVKAENGKVFNFIEALFGKDADKDQSQFAVNVTVDGVSEKLTVMKSRYLRSMFIVSKDPEGSGRAFVDAVKGNKADGNISFINTDGTVSYSGKLSEIKGRGNSTFRDYKKKPYQIKLKDKVDLIGGTDEERCKKWVLLANAADYTLAHNNATFELANLVGLTYTPIYESIDLYYDGEYRGTYCLTEKTEVGSSRVDIDEMDDIIEELNADNPALEAENSIVRTRKSNGNAIVLGNPNPNGSVKYIEGLIEPPLSEGASHHAYLLELEYSFRYPDEISGFISDRGQCVVTKSPELLTKRMSVFIANFWQGFEDAVYSKDGYNTKTGKYYYDYVDLDSLVNLYLINELGKNQDSFCSSFFFYMPADSDKLIAGPVWDYDLCYGVGHIDRALYSNPEKFLSIEKTALAKQLLNIESFREAIKATLNKENGKFYNATQQLLGEDGIIKTMTDKLYYSQKMNFALWDIYASDYYVNSEDNTPRIVVKEGAEPTYKNAVDFFSYFVSNRIDWLSEQTAKWQGDEYIVSTDKNTYYSGKTTSEMKKLIERLVKLLNRIFEFLKRFGELF